MFRRLLVLVYMIGGLALISGYAWASWRGLELTTAKKGFAPQGMRGRQGGANVFWYGGYRGGK